MVVTSSTFLSVEWASLPLPVVFLVLDKMLEPIDHVHFAAVCKEWRALAKDYNHATNAGVSYFLCSWSLQDPKKLSEECIALLKEKCTTLSCRCLTMTRCCGSCRGHGWLATIDLLNQDQITITLANPFLKPVASIRIPPLQFVWSFCTARISYPRLSFLIPHWIQISMKL